MLDNKPPLQPFSVQEIKNFVDYYMEHGETTVLPGHTEEECRHLAEFFGFGYLRTWSSEEEEILRQNYQSIGATETSKLLPYRTRIDVNDKANAIGLKNMHPCSQPHVKLRWTGWEEEIIIKYWAILGEKVAVFLPNRTEHACSGRAQLLNLSRKTPIIWSEEEDRIFRTYYPKIGSEVQKMLPGKSVTALYTRGRILGVKAPSPIWSEEDDRIMCENYPLVGCDVVSMLTSHKTKSACYQRAKKLGLCGNRKSEKWTSEEDNILKEYYPAMGVDVAYMLIKRSTKSVRRRAHELGLKSNKAYAPAIPWTHEEVDILVKNYPMMGASVSKLIPRHSGQQCVGKISSLGLGVPKKWTPEEDEILRNSYNDPECKLEELLPGRTKIACEARATRILGLSRKSPLWSEEEDEILRKYYPVEGGKTLARLPGRTFDAMCARAVILNVKKQIIEQN